MERNRLTETERDTGYSQEERWAYEQDQERIAKLRAQFKLIKGGQSEDGMIQGREDESPHKKAA